MLKFYLAILFLSSIVLYSQEIDRSNYQLLWEISGNGLSEPSYLFGTFHSNDEDIFDFPDSLYTVLNNAEAIVLEADITEVMDEADVIPSNWREYTPRALDWVIPSRSSDDITYTSYGSDAGRPQFIDLYFKQIADNCGKVFYPLERIEDQMKIGVNSEYKPVSKGHREIPSDEEMKTKYLEGDIKAIHDFTKLSTLNYTNLYEELISDRNKIMADGLDTIIHKHRTFCAVGSAHLDGKLGIIPLLEEKGYTLRPVTSDFSSEKSVHEEKLEKCRGYLYEDTRYGISLQFSGKPKVKDEEQGSRLVQYQEMGQGNTYSIRMTHYETIDDLDKVAASFFEEGEMKISDYRKIKMKNGVTVHQGKITEVNGQEYWMRSFHRNEILYLVYCTGGYRFVNSNRHLKFFDSFNFKKVHQEVVELNEKVISPTQTLAINVPAQYIENEEVNETDKYWRVKWFNPNNGESFYAYESVLTDNSIYFTDEAFGEFLIGEFDRDSIHFYDFKSNSKYSEKSFKAAKMGRKAYGKVRLIGNVLHFIQYTGTDLTVANQFLNDMQFQDFNQIDKEVELKNSIFKTNVTKAGFRPIKTEERYGFRTTKHYVLNDPINVITYEVYLKSFKKWAFSQKGTKQLLKDQVLWPSNEVPAEVDTTFVLSAPQPYMEFEIKYTSSKNLLKGKSYLNGKDIITFTQTQPLAAEDIYSSLSFLENSTFLDTSDTPINHIDTATIVEELSNNGTDNFEQLITNQHIKEETALNLFFLNDTLFETIDKDGSLQAKLISQFSTSSITQQLTETWKRRANKENILLTERVFELYAELPANIDDLSVMINHAESKSINWRNTNEVFQLVVNNTTSFEKLKPVFEDRMKDSLSWRMTFLIEDLLEQEFYRDYFLSDNFQSIALDESQKEWAAFRYFELFYEYSNSPEDLKQVIEKWETNDNPFRYGVKIAWKEILEGKSKRKERKKVEKNIVASTAYAKVMAVSNQENMKLFNFEEVIGLIAFDHYEDDFYDPNKTISYLENKNVNDGSTNAEYAFYKCVENKKVYYLARKIPKDRAMPSYKDFGNDTHFFQFESEPTLQEVIDDLEKRLL